jgi:L-asparaginase
MFWFPVVAFAASGARAAATVPAAADGSPIVRLVATGGTISNRTGGRLTAEELVGLIPDVTRYARPEFEQFANTSSSALTIPQLLELSHRLNSLFTSRPDLAGIVVTSGTDTLEEIAYFLHLTVRDARPVVVVGSMRNPSTTGYEGAANLLEGFRVAACPDARGQGALVVMNDEINSARDVTKTDALRLQTFQSRAAGLLGVVDTDRVVFYRSPVKRHTARSEFDVTAMTSLPRVDVVLTYQDAPGDLIKALVDLGAKGIVMATAGAGATSGTQQDGLRYAADKNVVVVTSTRTGSGRISGTRDAGGPPPTAGPGPGAPRPAVATAQASGTAQTTPPGGVQRLRRSIGAEDLAPIKARILLMLALANTSDSADIQRMFIEY